MSAGGKEYVCAWCGAPFFADKRHKYCSEECYTQANRERARVQFRRRYIEKHEQELARCRDYYARNAEVKNAKSRAYYYNNQNERQEYQREYYHRRKEAASNV